ncbi:uncharacterized protein ISCGN_026741 [Ixodes scapularis]
MELADTDASVQVTLPLSSINEYVAQEFATSRLLLEGEAVLEAGHVVTCSVKEKVDSNSTFVGFVLQTSALSRDPHELEIVVKEKTVAAASCSCKAGSYKCKHIVAMLLYIHATKVFEILSSTDLPQQWGKSQKQGVKDKYAPRPIIELPCVKKVCTSVLPLFCNMVLASESGKTCHFNGRRDKCLPWMLRLEIARVACGAYRRPIIKTASDASLEGDVLGKLLQGLPYRSAAHRHREEIPVHAFQCIEPEESPSPPQRPATLTEALRMMSRDNQASDDSFYEALQEMFSKAVVEEIATLTIQQAESPLWMEYRTGLISASVAYSVYTRVKTLRTKMGPHDLRPLFKVLMRESTFQSAAMARGSQDESTAKRKYLQESTHANLTIQDSGLLIMESEPCVGASPDGIVTCDCCERRLIEDQVINSWSSYAQLLIFTYDVKLFKCLLFF